MELWCSLCMSRSARFLAVTVTRGWALCERHAAYDVRLQSPELSEDDFRALLRLSAATVDC